MSVSTSGTGFRCSGASLARKEAMAGTASTVHAYLLVEFAGAWGRNALRDARLPADLGPRLERAAADAKVRVLLARRPGRSGVDGVRVLAAHARPQDGWLETGVLDDVRQVLDLDLAALRAGQGVGLTRTREPVFAVCTHGKHDACCAEHGRPVAAALEAAHPEHTWEVSHIGGDRFAANMVVLPHGLYYGRLDPDAGLAVAAATLSGDLELEHLRGRSSYAMPVQAAEIALRRELDEPRIDAVRCLDAARSRDLTTVTFDVGGAAAYQVRIRTRHEAPARLTCQAEKDNPIPVHDLVDLVRV